MRGLSQNWGELGLETQTLRVEAKAKLLGPFPTQNSLPTTPYHIQPCNPSPQGSSLGLSP